MSFEAFDEAMAREHRLGDPETTEDSLRRITTLLDALPQRGVISDGVKDRWIRRTYEQAEERTGVTSPGGGSLADIHADVRWHVGRASSFGGSDMGDILCHFRGERGGFSDARKIVLQKLLVIAPQPPTIEMSRGHRAEPWLQKMFQERTGARTDVAAMNAMTGTRHPDHPFLSGNPDDIVSDLVSLEGAHWDRAVIDYKCPSADVVSEYEKKGIAFDYICQLHHYADNARARGIGFDGMEVAAFDPRSFEISRFPVEWDQDLVDEITGCAHRLWTENVMTGEAPEILSADPIEIDHDIGERMVYEMTGLKSMEDRAKRSREDVEERLLSLIEAGDAKRPGTFDAGFASYSLQRNWDEDELRDLAVASGFDPAAYEKPVKGIDGARAGEMIKEIMEAMNGDGDLDEILPRLQAEGVPGNSKLDTARLAADLEAAGISVMSAASLKSRFALTRKASSPGMEQLGRIHDFSSQVLRVYEESLDDRRELILEGIEDDMDGPDM